MRTAPSLAALALLAACSPSPTATNNAQDAAIANRIELASNGKPVPADQAPHLAHHLAFPPPFVARWGRTNADCDPSNNNATGLMVVNTGDVRFMDATSTLKAIERPSRYAVQAELVDKQGTASRHTFALAAGGTALLRTDQSLGQTERYGRC